MTLLQPTDVPSRTGINNAISSEIDLAVRTTDPADQFYDSGWLTLPGTPDAGVSITTKQYRVKNGMVQVRFAGTLTAGISVPVSGNIADIHIGDLPAGARPGGGGMNTSTVLPVEVNGSVMFALIYNGGSINLAYCDRTGATYTFGAATNPLFCNSPLYTINS